jgi:anti-anti-sigma factor
MEPQILFACIDNCCFFKLSGELRYTNATGMDDFIKRLFSNKVHCEQIVIDLNDASFIDSTHIGLLASFARYCQRQQLPKPTLFSSQSEINELLFGLCLEQAFNIIQQPTNHTFDMTTIAASPCTEQQQGGMILRAHQALIDLNGKNKAAFQPVVDLLKQQLK